ncbi:MAG TPA: protein kinase [Candidatus Acidoferrales bacterium]|jgi:tetratricopeptide (TPR) repeat protein|nr:protein kinase [Candidatus Acidoferrales bacterium]
MIAPASRKLGKYEIRRKLGRGGMADVYLAQDTELGHMVALKLIEDSSDPDTRDGIEAERRGAVLQAHLAAVDPRVVRVYDSGDLEGYFFVAMEYIDGQDLADLVRRGKLEIEFAADVAIAVASTLENAHTLRVAIGGKDYRGVVHGDIKPKNIRIDSHGEVRVLDFGIAKALSLSRKLTRNEFGSVPYSSPERLDLGEVDAGSDLWSLGVMLYELVTGMQPYHAETTERLERMIRSGIAAPPAPDPCPEPLRRIMMKAMAPDPAVRYPSAAEFRQDLQAFRSGSPVAAMSSMGLLDCVGADLDATRRTTHLGSDPDETRRTRPHEPAQATPPSRDREGAVAKPARARMPVPLARTLAILFVASLIYGIYALVGDYLLYRQGQELAREIQAEQVTDPAEIWTKWTELSNGNPSSFLLRGPRNVVKQKFVAAADHVIDTYRNNEGQQIYEKDWERARTMAAHALAIEPDNTVRGKVRLSEGHISRINAGAHHSLQEYNTAVDEFNEAQRLLPKSPDPQLGLARVYVYGLKDIDKAYQALEEAQKRGYQLGNRDKGQLADGYLARADRLWKDSNNMRGLPQEKDQIQRAADDYKHASELYQEVVPWGNSTTNITRIQVSLDNANLRLQQIESGVSPSGAQNSLEIHRGMKPGEILRRILRAVTNSGQSSGQ